MLRQLREIGRIEHALVGRRGAHRARTAPARPGADLADRAAEVPWLCRAVIAAAWRANTASQACHIFVASLNGTVPCTGTPAFAAGPSMLLTSANGLARIIFGTVFSTRRRRRSPSRGGRSRPGIGVDGVAAVERDVPRTCLLEEAAARHHHLRASTRPLRPPVP